MMKKFSIMAVLCGLALGMIAGCRGGGGTSPGGSSTTDSLDVVFVTNENARTLMVVDLLTGFSRIANVGLDAGANDLQFRPGSNELWVLHSMSPTMKRYSISTDKTLPPTFISPTYSLEFNGLNKNPYSFAFSNTGLYYYVSNSLVNSVTMRSTSDNSLISSLYVGRYPEGIAVLPNGKVVVANSGFISLGVYSTGNVVLCDSMLADTLVRGSVGINPQVIRYYNNALYVICSGDYGSTYSTLWKLDPATLQPLTSAPISLTGAFASDLAIDVDSTAGIAWGVLPAWSMTGNTGAIFVVNLTNWTVQQTIESIDGGPTHTVALPQGGTVTSLFSANKLLVRLRDGTTYRVNAGDGPWSVAAARK